MKIKKIVLMLLCFGLLVCGFQNVVAQGTGTDVRDKFQMDSLSIANGTEKIYDYVRDGSESYDSTKQAAMTDGVNLTFTLNWSQLDPTDSSIMDGDYLEFELCDITITGTQPNFVYPEISLMSTDGTNTV